MKPRSEQEFEVMSAECSKVFLEAWERRYKHGDPDLTARPAFKEAWDYQQQRINKLREALKEICGMGGLTDLEMIDVAQEALKESEPTPTTNEKE